MNSLPRVLFINHSIRDGGPGKSLFYILKYLDRSQIIPYVLIPKDEVFSERLKAEGIYENIILDKRFPENLKRPRLGIAFQKEGNNQTGYLDTLMKFLSVLLNIIDMLSLIVTSPFWLRKNKIDVIYCNGTQAKVVGALIGFVNWCPVIWHVRNIQQTKLLGYVINTLSKLSVVRRIICVSSATAKPFAQVKQKVRVIYNGVDIENYNPATIEGELRAKYNLSNETIVIGSTGRIVPRKGYDLFIKSAKIVIDQLDEKSRDIKFVIVGDTPYFFQDDHLSYLKKLVTQNGLDDYFIFDVGQLGDYILELVKDADLRKKMGLAGRKRVKDNFLAIDRTKDIQRNILEVLGIYK